MKENAQRGMVTGVCGQAGRLVVLPVAQGFAQRLENVIIQLLLMEKIVTELQKYLRDAKKNSAVILWMENGVLGVIGHLVRKPAVQVFNFKKNFAILLNLNGVVKNVLAKIVISKVVKYDLAHLRRNVLKILTRGLIVIETAVWVKDRGKNFVQ